MQTFMLYYEMVNLLPKPQCIGSMAYCLVIKKKKPTSCGLNFKPCFKVLCHFTILVLKHFFSLTAVQAFFLEKNRT